LPEQGKQAKQILLVSERSEENQKDCTGQPDPQRPTKKNPD
jgi:hypothetical protein